MNTKILGIFVNLAIGISWSLLILGMVYGFLRFYHADLIMAVFATLLGAIPGLLLVLVFEFFLLAMDLRREVKKQTRILQKAFGKEEVKHEA